METANTVDFARRDGITDALRDLLRTGAQQLIATAVEAQLTGNLAQFADLRTDTGRAFVHCPAGYCAAMSPEGGRNGHYPARPLYSGIGPVSVRIPKVRSKDRTSGTFRSAQTQFELNFFQVWLETRHEAACYVAVSRKADSSGFSSNALVPPYLRTTKTLEAALPSLYLKEISSDKTVAVLKVLLGPDTPALSANAVSRLKRDWSKEFDGWRDADLDGQPIVYIRVDGVHSGIRDENDKLCALAIVGVTACGKKRFLAIENGARESIKSWCEVLLRLKSREMNAPELPIGDGAMGFCAALEEVYPEASQQRFWQRKTMNVLNFLPKLSQPKAKVAIHNIWQAENKVDAHKAVNLFIETYEPKCPKVAVCLRKDREELMVFFNFPDQHWQSIRTSNPIESAFATIRHRTKRSKACLSRDAMLLMLFKLGQCAEQNWRKLRGFDTLAKVITGVTFKDGIKTTNPDQIAA